MIKTFFFSISDMGLSALALPASTSSLVFSRVVSCSTRSRQCCDFFSICSDSSTSSNVYRDFSPMGNHISAGNGKHQRKIRSRHFHLPSTFWLAFLNNSTFGLRYSKMLESISVMSACSSRSLLSKA